MAIKVKNKSKNVEPEVEVLDTPETGDAAIAQSGYTLSKGNWFEENTQLVFGGIIVFVAVVMAIYFGIQFMETGKVEASSTLTPAYDTYNQLVKDSEAVKQLEANENLQVPENLLESEEARWNAMYASSTASLDKNGSNEVAKPARLVKAASALQLGKFDEAITLYQDALKAADKLEKAPIYQGLATAQAGKGDFDAALKTFDELSKVDEKFVKALRYERGQLLETAGKTKEAKSLYHEILEDEPAHPSRSDIERRLATL